MSDQGPAGADVLSMLEGQTMSSYGNSNTNSSTALNGNPSDPNDNNIFKTSRYELIKNKNKKFYKNFIIYLLIFFNYLLIYITCYNSFIFFEHYIYIYIYTAYYNENSNIILF